MALKVQEFKQRMRHDRSFRQRILAAQKDGTLAVILVQEGYELDFNSLDVHLPHVRTGLRGGQCYCLLSSPESNKE
jgi:hypothetical protein